jgi:uncharacterized protein YegP (UPF0339 family)/tetratricopeptide (TPR) repeat protein
MHSYFKKAAEHARNLDNDAEARLVTISTLRLYLQQVVFGLLEWVGSEKPDADRQPDEELLRKLRAPTDGTLVEALEILTVCCEQLGWTGISRLGTRPLPTPLLENAAEGFSPTTFGLLRALVSMRNNGAEGHGLLGGFDRSAEYAALAHIIETFSPALPRRVGDSVRIGCKEKECVLSFARPWDGSPVLVRKIKPGTNGKVHVEGQVFVDFRERTEFNFEAPDPFSAFDGTTLPHLEISDAPWKPLVQIPSRVTDTFAGRSAEIDSLREWMDDEVSRACLVYGDGGFGKTTLVLEFVHRLLEVEVATTWKPQVITYYTAKRWRWGLNGLEPIGAGQPHLMDLLSHLHKVLVGRYPEPKFYTLGVVGAATLLQAKMAQELGLNRAEHLIIVDNAETLIESEQEREQLGKELKEIARRLGRILVTSRRREILEASPVEVKHLSKKDAVRLIKNRGLTKFKLGAIKRATDQQLADIAKDLEFRPLVLEALLRALQDPVSSTLVKAQQRVSSMLGSDLGDFLFADAWARLSVEVRSLLLLMAKVADVHDAEMLRLACDQAELTVQRAEGAFEESGGIASVVRKEGNIEIAFSKNFMRFAGSRTVLLPDGRTFPAESDVARVRSRYSQFMRAARSFRGDRIGQAFRSPAARAAHGAVAENRLEDAKILFQQATLADATNGWLFDRYAYFLFHEMRDNQAALHWANRAVAELPQEGEVWYTKGLIESRLGQLRAANASLDRAQELGVTKVRCSLQRCWAYLKADPAQLTLAEQEIREIEAQMAGKTDSRVAVELSHIRAKLENLQARGKAIRGYLGAPPAVATIPARLQIEETTRASRYVLSGSSATQFHFVLKAGNKETILRSEHYASKQGALNGIESVKANSPNEARYERKNAADGSPMFNLKAANGETIGTSQMYSSTGARDEGIALVKANGRGASTVDESE